MANEEVLGPRKTMFVLVIVVGCFAVLWPRILSPLILGHTRDQLKPNQFDREAAVKQERPSMRVGPHPALRERGRAIPPGPSPQPRPPITMPPHARPPPIPGMRPPLGSPGGPVAAPKSSMGFVMPIYTICIIVFFVYTLSKILFKRTGSTPYEAVSPDPQFRRRVFRDDSRTSPDKLGPKERDTRDDELEALRARLAETERAMQRIVGQLAKRDADLQDNHARPYTNGTVLHNTGPVHIVAKTENAVEISEDVVVKSTEDFLDNAREVEVVSAKEFEESPKKEERTTPELLEEALKEDSSEKGSEDGAEEDQEKPSVKHEAESVQSIFLETQIPQQARVLVADFQDHADARTQPKHSPTVVSGKMTLSLIQDAPRDTPDRDLESTVDDFTTASGVTQPAAEKDEELSDEEIDEEIEIEEIEEEVEEVDEEEEPKKNSVQKK